MSLIENALNKAGSEIREPVPQEGSPEHQSVKNILRLPSPLRRTRTISKNGALIALLFVILIGGIVYFVIPKTDDISSPRQAVAHNRTAAPLPAPTTLAENSADPEQKAPVVETAPVKESTDRPIIVPATTVDKIEPTSSSYPEPDLKVAATNATVPEYEAPSVEPKSTENDREAARISFLLKKAYLYGETGKHVLALRCYNDILSQDPGNYDALLNRGIVNQKLGYQADAEKDLQQALALNSQDPVLLNSLGVSYLGSGQVEQGRHLLQSAGTTTALINLARYYWSSGSWSNVEQTLKDAQRLDGDCPYTAYYLGLYYRDRKEPERARASMDRAVKLARKRGLTEVVNAAEASSGIKNPERNALSRTMQ